MSTIVTGSADCGGRGMERLQLVEDLEPEGLDDRRVEDVQDDEEQDEQRADQAGRQVDEAVAGCGGRLVAAHLLFCFLGAGLRRLPVRRGQVVNEGIDGGSG